MERPGFARSQAACAFRDALLPGVAKNAAEFVGAQVHERESYRQKRKGLAFVHRGKARPFQ